MATGDFYDIQPPAHFNCRCVVLPMSEEDVWEMKRALVQAFDAARGFKGTADIPASQAAQAAIAEHSCGVPDNDGTRANDQMLDDLLDWLEWRESA